MMGRKLPGSTLRGAVALAAACFVAGGCDRRVEPIRVGFVAGLTGRHYGLGVSCRNGAQLAVEEINASGGVAGRPLELLVKDDAQDPEIAKRAVRELIRDRVVAILGHSTSSMAEATLAIADEEHVLMMSPTVELAPLLRARRLAGAPRLLGRGHGAGDGRPRRAEAARAPGLHRLRPLQRGVLERLARELRT